MFLTTESQDLDLHQGKLVKILAVRVYILYILSSIGYEYKELKKPKT